MENESTNSSKEESNDSNIIEEYEFRKITRSGEEKGIEPVAVEKSYDLIVNSFRIASLMASPLDLKELGYGYLVSEGIVDSKDQIKSIKLKNQEIHAFVEEFERTSDHLELRSSGCMGVSWDKEEEEGTVVDSDLTLTSDQIFESLEHLETELYNKTSGSHSATLLNRGGDVLAKSVDVGRHNTFDKVIGKGIVQEIDLSKSMLLASGRQSAGTVMKAARANIPIIVSKAAPISSGIKVATRTGLTLICFADDEKFIIFSGDHRIE